MRKKDLNEIELGADTMTYMGYTGTAEVSLSDNLLYGKILDIPDLISYEAKSVQGLKTRFMKDVEDYILTRSSLDGKDKTERRNYLGKTLTYEVDGIEKKCVCTTMKNLSGTEFLYLREILPPHKIFWYNPITKKTVL